MSREPVVSRREFLKTGASFAALSGLGFTAPDEARAAQAFAPSPANRTDSPRGWVPQPYTIQRDAQAGTLTLSTRYYTVEHDLNKGGAISKISYTHGRSKNLLLSPIETWVIVKQNSPSPRASEQERHANTFSDLQDSSPSISVTKSGKIEIVTVQATLRNDRSAEAGIKTKTTYFYRWGYIKVHKEFMFPASPLEIPGISVFSTQLDPSLTHYMYRPNISESMTPELHDWELDGGWGKVRAGSHLDPPFLTRYIPQYLSLINPGIEGIEWFVSDDLAQWNYQMTAQPGTGYTEVKAQDSPLGLAVSINPLDLAPKHNLPRGGFITPLGSYSFDYYIGMPILEGHTDNPWFDRSFTPDGGKWVSEDQIKRNAELGVRTMRLHDDGDEHGDGLFWRDGSWPPYPPDQMKKMAEVIDNCHKYGIKTATYFSCHELNQNTVEFKQHGEEWGTKPDDQGNLRPNYKYGATMCLKSGWLDYLKLCVDRALKHFPLDGVYYDWSLGLYCNNAQHVGKTSNGVSGTKQLGALALSPTGHWDIDELLDFMEWTRERVGPDGLVLLHDAPMFATENFVNAICPIEAGYGQLSTSVPRPEELPLEWNYGGSRQRAVIEYGAIAKNAPTNVHQVFYLTTLITGTAVFPASDGALELFKILTPLGDLRQYQFEGWKNSAVNLSENDCFSAVYSRPGDAYLILANLCPEPRRVKCTVNPRAFKDPIRFLTSVELISGHGSRKFSADMLTHDREKFAIPAEGALLLHVK